MENTNSSSHASLDDSLLAKKKEIEDMKNDSLQLRKTARTLLPVVQEYNKLNQEANTLDKERRNKERAHNLVVDYLSQIDTHYLDGFYPLFKEKHQHVTIDPEPSHPKADPPLAETGNEQP